MFSHSKASDVNIGIIVNIVNGVPATGMPLWNQALLPPANESNVFAPVCHSVHRGWGGVEVGWLYSIHHKLHERGAGGGLYPLGLLREIVCIQGGCLHLGRGRGSAQGSLHLRGSASGGLSIRGSAPRGDLPWGLPGGLGRTRKVGSMRPTGMFTCSGSINTWRQ